jgi:hypothetical protein
MVIDALTLRASDGVGPCVSEAAMTIHREQMMTALTAVFVPVLRQRGFVGSFPHFRRKLDQRIDFLNVQFNRYGGSFCLNIGQTGPDGLEDPDWPDLSLAATTVGHLRYRSRVGKGFLAKQWFEFGPKSQYSLKPARPVSFYESIAADAVRAFEKDGERCFNKQPAVPVM